MDYLTFLTHIIEDGLAGAKKSYATPEQAAKLRGSTQGFEECRRREPAALLTLRGEAGDHATKLVGSENVDLYWECQCRFLEIDFVCNVVSAALLNEGKAPIVTPTSRGVIRAAEILARRN